MKIGNKFIPILITLLLTIHLLDCASMKKTDNIKIKLTEISTIPHSFGDISKGVSAAFVGFLDNNLVVIGGCNFPEVPAAQKGKKVFYQDILIQKNDRWEKIGSLPQKLAYGVSITTSDGLFCIGGQNNETSSSAVYKISLDKQNQAVLIHELPSLPVSFDNGAGALINNSLYIVGGNQNGSASSYVWFLDLETAQNWVKHSSIPIEGGLVQPTATSTRNNELFIFGGFTPPTESSLCVVHNSVWRNQQGSEPKWTTLEEFPSNEAFVSLSGGTSAIINDSLILLIGGVNKGIFENAMNRNIYLEKARKDENTNQVEKLLKEASEYMWHEPDWYQFNNYIWAYNVNSNTWSDLGKFPKLALAGASIVSNDNEVFIVNGEIKPGIRTPEIWKIEIEK